MFQFPVKGSMTVYQMTVNLCLKFILVPFIYAAEVQQSSWTWWFCKRCCDEKK